jgi:GTP-binding protein
MGAAAPEQLPPASVPEIAFAGRSNAGKSTAINVLAGRTPGRTQQINLFSLRGGALVADLPGYGYAAVGKALKRAWQEFLWYYITTRPTLVALVLIVDARHGLKDLDIELLAGFVPSGRPVLILATKSDKLNTTAQRAAVSTVRKQLAQTFPLGAENVTVQLFSATARIGIEEAEAKIAGWL